MPNVKLVGAQSASFHAVSTGPKVCAVSHNDEYVSVYDTKNNPENPDKWVKTCDLQEDAIGEEKMVKLVLPPLHSGYVSGIDWCPSTNSIVTCGHDRNAYVWNEEKGVWKPRLVILRIQRAATGVKWSPKGDKFAVTSGNKCVPVCHFEDSQGFNWWISKMIKKHKSTVLTLDWSPNNKFVVTGGCDFRCRVFSAYIEGIDDKDLGPYSHWSNGNEFGECLAEFDQAKAWVQGVSWSPGGMKIAFVGHGSTLHVANLADSSVNTTHVKTLPYHDVQFVDDKKIVCCGFDNNPTIWVSSGDDWKLDKKLDPETDGKKKASGNAAFNKFKAADSKGQSDVKETNPIKTLHKAQIRDVKLHDWRGKRTHITTCGIDGRILTWKL
jgi:actin related protein 2/3 complex subunit 1A/1B